MGKILIITGLSILIIGLIWQYQPNLINWFGRLPGDIRFENENSKVFIPITSMILVSLALSVILNLIRKFF